MLDDDEGISFFGQRLEGIEEAIKRHREESRETDRMSHLAVMFEFPSYMDASRAKMKTVKEELEALKSLWAIVKDVQDTFAGFNKVRPTTPSCGEWRVLCLRGSV